MAIREKVSAAVRSIAANLRRVRNSADYEAGSTGTRRTATWRASTVTPNAAVLGNLATLRDRSRAAVRNNGYGKGVVDSLVSEMIGTGIQPEPQASLDLPQMPHPVTGQLVQAREAIKALFLIWTDESDADGVLDFYGQMTQAVRCWLEGGEAFVRLRPRLESDGLSVPLQIQVLEPELCPHSHTLQSSTGNNIRAGIEFSPIGKPAAYYFHPSRPDVDDFDTSQLHRLLADTVIHLYDPLRAGQIRGIPHLTQALIRLYELDKYDDATLLRQQLSNLFVGFLKRSEGVGATDLNPLSGATQQTSPAGEPMIPLAPGLWQQLEPGEEVEFSDPPTATGFADFMRQNLYAVAAATGVPYEVFTGDMRSVNDRTARLILLKFRRQIQQQQHQIVVQQFCRRVWRAWMDRVFLSGALPIPIAYLENPAPWLAVEWKPHAWPYMNPVQDVQAEKDAIRVGLKSRSSSASERGDSAEAIDREQAADNARADALGLKYDSDGRNPSNGAPVPPDAQEPEQAPGGPVPVKD